MTLSGPVYYFLSLDLTFNRIAVEDSYDGPRMNEDTKTIDKEFLEQMIERLKDQKKIHKKYVFRVCSLLNHLNTALYHSLRCMTTFRSSWLCDKLC